MSKAIRVTLANISGAATDYYYMTDNLGNTVFSQVYGASLSNGITYSVNRAATSFTITNIPSTSDVTPNAVNWGDAINNIVGQVTTNVQQITGINSDINLRISWIINVNQIAHTFTISVNNSNSYGGTITTLTDPGPVDVIVSPNQYVSFRLVSVGAVNSKTVSVINLSDNSTTIDTFVIEASSVAQPE